jgi:hypothetical protein
MQALSTRTPLICTKQALSTRTPLICTMQVLSNTSSEVVLQTSGGMSVTVSYASPTVALSLNGSTVFREFHAFERVADDVDCIPPGWKPLDKSQASSLRAPDGVGCLRHTRTLGPDEDV